MEEVKCGNLKDLFVINQNIRTIDWKLRFKIVYELASALDYLHFHNPNQSYIHLDVKPENILLTKELTVKLTDFGALEIALRTGAIPTTELSANKQHTPYYTAPERLRNLSAKPKSSMDVYWYNSSL